MTILCSASLHRSELGIPTDKSNYTLTISVGDTIRGVDLILREDMPEAAIMGSVASALEAAANSLRIGANFAQGNK